MLLFSKMQGTGNDFIIINCLNQFFNYNLNILSKFLCNRNFGIGADGVIYIFQSSIADYKMRIFNSDGSEAEMCGNGIRCLGKYLYEKNITLKTELKIETLAGIKDIELNFQNKSVFGVRVKMGKPIFDSEKIPVFLPKTVQNSEPCEVSIKLDNTEYKFSLVSIGNPHAVCFVKDLNKINIFKFGPKVENYKYFPTKTNVEFVQIIDRNNIKIKVWERGAGNTISCGTGACASVACGVKHDFIDKNVTAILDGGKLHINYIDDIFMSGPAEFVFEGRIDL